MINYDQLMNENVANGSTYGYSSHPLVNQSSNDPVLNDLMIQEFTTRIDYFRRMLDPRRDIDAECGFPKGELLAVDYQEMYDYDAIANRVVEVLPREMWQITPLVYEKEEGKVATEFEQRFDEIGAQLLGMESYYNEEEGSSFWDLCLQADINCGIGKFGIFLLGIDDGLDYRQPVDGINPDDVVGMYSAGQGQYYDYLGYSGSVQQPNYASTPKMKRSTKPHKLLFMRVYPESLVQITKYESRMSSPRFGRPVEYLLTFNDPRQSMTGIGLPMGTLQVHWTRVVHIVDNPTANPVIGMPRMQPVRKQILSLMKLYGGSGEMYWKGAFPGIHLGSQEGLGGQARYNKGKMRDMLEQYFNGLQRYMVTTGFNASMLSPTVVDPAGFIDVQIQGICIKIPCPQRVFLGSERGELASTEDDAKWNDVLRARMRHHGTPRVLCPLVNRLIWLDVLPEPKDGYKVHWPDLDSQTDAEKANIASTRAMAMATYVGPSGNVGSLISPTGFLTHEMGFDEDEAEALLEEAKASQAEQQQQQMDQQQQMIDAGLAPDPTQEGQTGATAQPGQPTTNTLQDFKRIGNFLRKSPLAMPGYGQIFVNDENEDPMEEVWYVGGDGDEDGFHKLVESKLKAIGAKKVRYESEDFPPEDQSWMQVYPEKRAWTSETRADGEKIDNCQPGQMREAKGRCGPGIGVSISRDKMPQIPTDSIHDFIQFAKERGVGVVDGFVIADELSPTQGEFRQSRVDGLPDHALSLPILVSADDYILDGTHRWVKHWQLDRSKQVPILRLKLPLHDALDLMREFPDAKYAENAVPPRLFRSAQASLEKHGWTPNDIDKEAGHGFYEHPDHPGHQFYVHTNGDWEHVDDSGKFLGTGRKLSGAAQHLHIFHLKPTTTAPEEHGFIHAIKSEPENDLHKKVYADWLQDRGHIGPAKKIVRGVANYFYTPSTENIEPYPSYQALQLSKKALSSPLQPVTAHTAQIAKRISEGASHAHRNSVASNTSAAIRGHINAIEGHESAITYQKHNGFNKDIIGGHEKAVRAHKTAIQHLSTNNLFCGAGEGGVTPAPCQPIEDQHVGPKWTTLGKKDKPRSPKPATDLVDVAEDRETDYPPPRTTKKGTQNTWTPQAAALERRKTQHTPNKLELRIRHELSDESERKYPYQLARVAHLPAHWQLEEAPRARDIAEGEQRHCYNCALDKAKKEGYELHAGVIVEHKDLGSEDKPFAVKHAWGVKDGKIHDFVLGSKRSNNFHYIGEKLNPHAFNNSEELQKHITSQVREGMGTKNAASQKEDGEKTISLQGTKPSRALNAALADPNIVQPGQESQYCKNPVGVKGKCTNHRFHKEIDTQNTTPYHSSIPHLDADPDKQHRIWNHPDRLRAGQIHYNPAHPGFKHTAWSTTTPVKDALAKVKAANPEAPHHDVTLTEPLLRQASRHAGVKYDPSAVGHTLRFDAKARDKFGRGGIISHVLPPSTQNAWNEETFTPHPREAHLHAEVAKTKKLGGGVNDTHVITMHNGVKAVWKPKEGERTGYRPNVPDKTNYQRETAASHVAHHMGLDHMVPITTTRHIGGKEGSAQEFVPHATIAHGVSNPMDGKENKHHAAAFDYVIGQTDRHHGNWMLTHDQPKKGIGHWIKSKIGGRPKGNNLKLIDNGLSFPTHERGRHDLQDSEFLRHSVKDKIPDMSHLEGKWHHIEKGLHANKIEPEAIAGAKNRFHALIKHSKEGKTFGDLPYGGEMGATTVGQHVANRSRY